MYYWFCSYGCSIQKNKKMSNFNDIINSEKPVLVDFFATWCGPCQMLLPVLNQVKESLQDRITIIKIDVDKTKHWHKIPSSRSSYYDAFSRR
jgi:thiol-disulfide isomerase/thioredoxin